MAELRPKILKLARLIAGVTGITTTIDENAPEYYCMADLLTDEEADVAIAAGLRKERTADYLAKKVKKSPEELKPILDNLVYYGIFRRSFNKELGEDTYYMQIFAPGILEMMVNQKELLETHPEVGRAFEEYTRNLAANMGAMLPNGYGLMRVVPVESAIQDLPGVSDFEKLSYYLNKYDRFSVSPCSCRASRSNLGDGCGHLAEDMCIQMGKGAEHYIRTGRAREITREEALEIIKRAEDNGLMHDMVNIEEAGESAAICNCCACACFGLRVGLMYGARDAIRSNFVAEIDESKCVACAQCVEVCPGNALKLGQKLCSSDSLSAEPEYVKLSETVFKQQSWNPDYRENRKDTLPTGTAPCKVACPAHIPVQGYLKLAAQGRYTEALKLIKKENPFPAVCGRICNKRCEAECTRGSVDEAVAIDEVKRFIADHDLHETTRYVPPMVNQIGKPYPQKIAVIGAGPAGMSCAYYLAEKGYPVTVFDRNPVPGGMLTLGIPSFRLEKDVLNAEIDILREMGVEFKCGVEVGKDVTIQQLRDEGYKGFYVAIGAQKSAPIGVPGETLANVYGGVDFLREVNLGNQPFVGKTCAVIGGGNVAMDVCRSAIRLGAQDTYVLYRRTQNEMPADPDEVAEAMEEGVQFRFLNAPAEILGEDGKVTGIRVEIMALGEPDEKGRRKPVGTGQFETLAVDSVIGAIGQQIDWGCLDTGALTTGKKGAANADTLTYQTAQPDIFVGGDCYTGPKFAIDAIAAGKEGAISLHRFVHEGQTLTMGRDRREYTALNKNSALISVGEFDTDRRQVPGYNKAKANTFADARCTFTEEQVRKETARCLGCGATKVDEYLCIGCGLCTTKCAFDAIHLKKVRDWHAGSFETMPIKVAEHVVKKTGKIIGKTLKK
ncbi:MAG: FAD-dependent oxidoreductase [Oscillospiraceae bacterium]|nr:FAD-dependent oxidoreductase [Oscillospiraceae bacterium]